MGDEMTLPEIKQVELQVLKQFKAFCEKEDIRYCLSNGTLLGAVKYGGFIPWDDDIDVFVPRKDYDRLIQNYPDTQRYRLFSHERDSHYKFPFAKLCDMTTRKVEQNVDNGVELGLDIDIFPLDAWGTEPEKQARQIGKLIRKITFVKCARAIGVNPIKRVVKDLVLWLTRPTYKYYIRRIWSIARSSQEQQYLGCVCWCIYGEREIVPAHVFGQMVDITFEGETFPAPQGYDRYLRSLYGDYTKDPPIEEQVTHHRYRAYRL